MTMSEVKKPNNLSAALDACIKAFAYAPDSDFEMCTPLEGTVEHPVAAKEFELPDMDLHYNMDKWGDARPDGYCYPQKETEAVFTEAQHLNEAWESTLSLAGCVKDGTNPCGWRNKRAEEAESKAESLRGNALNEALLMVQAERLESHEEYLSINGEGVDQEDFAYSRAIHDAENAISKLLESSSIPQDAAKEEQADDDGGLVVHELKIWPQHFKAVSNGTKKFEIRKNDRGFKVGDLLDLLEFDPTCDKYVTEEEGDIINRTMVRVTYLVQGVFGLPADVAVMSIAPLNLEQPKGDS
jgi:hypothetical protein